MNELISNVYRWGVVGGDGYEFVDRVLWDSKLFFVLVGVVYFCICIYYMVL